MKSIYVLSAVLEAVMVLLIAWLFKMYKEEVGENGRVRDK
jgi:hypothetical protein